MAKNVSPKTIQALIYIPYAVAALVVLFIFGRYVLRVGGPPGPPPQGGEIPSMRGGGIFIIEHSMSGRTKEQVHTYDDGMIIRSLVVDDSEDRSRSDVLRPELLAAIEQFQQTWCEQTALPPMPAATADIYRLYLSCTTWTGRMFYFANDQLPPVLVQTLRAAPPLRGP